MTEKDQQDIKGALGAVLFALIAPFIIVWLMYYINTPSWQRWVCEAGYGTLKCVKMYWLGN